MLRFSCRCQHVFELPDNQAGLSLQCPHCGLLVDIPGFGDVGSIEPDGTYRLDSRAEPVQDENLDGLTLTYYPARQLPDGSEIDLRGPVQPLPVIESSSETPPRERPKYDPETGELMRPLELDESSAAPAAPHKLPEAKRVIDYNLSPDALEGMPHSWGIYAALFLPSNLFVMFILLVAHVAFAVLFILAYALPLLMVFPLAILMLIAGHYAITLEETGPFEKDDLPRPLRNVQLYDDYFVPAGRVALTLLLCYAPALLILYMNFSAATAGAALPFPLAGRWLLAIYLLGSVLLPAVFLTICTSGTLTNLRPDRVIRLMGSIGVLYPLFVLEWLLASAIYLLGVIAMIAGFVNVFPSSSGAAMLGEPFVAFPLLVTGMYLTFAFCWHLGLHYRMHWHDYPWIAQYHERRTVTIRRPTLHPKVSSADENAARRAKSRPPQIR